LAIHRRRPERDVFDGLHEDAAFVGPTRDVVLPKEMSRQAVHLPQIPVLVDGLGVDIVSGDVIGSRHYESAELAFLASHPVQRLDVRRNGNERDKLGICMVKQFSPGTLDRHRFHFTSVTR
jgi:hypothetical protein